MSDNPSFKTAAQVSAICETMQVVETKRAQDRALIDNLFNGGRPYTSEEAEKYQIHVNVNWQEGSKILQDANRQINNALIFKEHFFNAKSMGGKLEKRMDYGEIFTKHIHRPLKRRSTGKRHSFIMKSRNASVSLHGVGVLMWMNNFSWMPRFIPLEDMLVPTDTLVDFSNLNHFAVNLYLTQSEFFDMTHGEKVDKGWNIKAVRQILDDLVPTSDQQASSFTWQTQPEKRIEHYKQNRCFYDSDAVPTVKLRMFYYKDGKTGKWYRCAILREGTKNMGSDKEFIYDGRKSVFSEDLDRMMHVQFGDNSLCAPLRYHSVRGLGVMLYSPIECNNRLRCEMAQHVFLNLKTLLRIENPVDRDRPKLLDLSQYSVVEQGVNFIPNDQRHEVDPRLVEYIQSQMRQLMSEGSASYVQDINDGTSKERTATETNAIVQSVNVQVNAMLQSMYEQEEHYYEEIVRRFLDKHSKDPEVKKFQEACKKDGIPDELMVPENWEVHADHVLGAGDQFLATQEANSLLSQKQWMDPSSQKIVERKWVSTTTRDPALAELLVPSRPVTSRGTIAAEDVFGTLMIGIPATIREGIDRVTYVEAMLGMLGEKIKQVESLDNMGTPQDLVGLKTVADHIQKNIQILSNDPQMKQQVKIYSDELGKLVNKIKGFDQRQQQKAQEQAAMQDPEVAAKAQATQMLAQQKAEISQQASEQKMQHKQSSFEQQMSQMVEKHQLEMSRLIADANAQIAATTAKVQADIENSRKQAEAQARATEKKSEQPANK